MSSHRPPRAVAVITQGIIDRLHEGVTAGYVSDRTGLNRAEVRGAMMKIGARYFCGRWRRR